MLKSLLFSITMAGVLQAWPNAAAACGSCACYEDEVLAVPDSARSLPLSPRVFALLSGPDTSGVTWTRVSDDADVPLTFTPAGGPTGATWISPQTMLDPGTEYRLDLGGGRQRSFTTGQAAVVAPPDPPRASIRVLGQTASCADIRGAVLVVEALGSGPDMLLQLDVSGPDGAQRVFLSAATGVPAELPFGLVTSGEPGCLGARALTGARLGVSYTATLTTFDAAGNSASIDLPPFQLADLSAGGCPGPEGACALGAQPAQHGTALWALLGMSAGALALRRSKPTSRARHVGKG